MHRVALAERHWFRSSSSVAAAFGSDPGEDEASTWRRPASTVRDERQLSSRVMTCAISLGVVAPVESAYAINSGPASPAMLRARSTAGSVGMTTLLGSPRG